MEGGTTSGNGGVVVKWLHNSSTEGKYKNWFKTTTKNTKDTGKHPKAKKNQGRV